MNTIDFSGASKVSMSSNAVRQNSAINFTGIPKVSDALRGLAADVFQKSPKVTPAILEDFNNAATFNAVRKFITGSTNGLYSSASIAAVCNGRIVAKDNNFYQKGIKNIPGDIKKLVEKPGYDFTIVRGYEKIGSDMTCPPTLGSAIELINNPGIKSTYVINADGEYAALRRVGSNVLTDKELKQLEGSFVLGYIDEVGKDANLLQKMQMNMPGTVQNIHDGLTGYSDILSIYGMDAGKTAQYTDNFWKANAQKFGLEYKSFN